MAAVVDSRQCCPLVCVVHPAAFANVCIAPQPIQMPLMAPVAPEISFDSAAGLNLMQSSSLQWPGMDFNKGSPSWGWQVQPVQTLQVPVQHSVDAVWPSSEQAHMQGPMIDPAPNTLDSVPALDSLPQLWIDVQGVDAPAQFQMDVSAPQETELPESRSCSQATTKSTLRRRGGHDNTQKGKSAEMQPRTACADGQEADADQDDLEQAEYARAREIVDNLFEQLKLGDCEKRAAIDRFKRLAFDSKTSSRAAQMALAEASASDAVALSFGLRGEIRDAVQSKHANYVVQKIMEVVPLARVSFVVEELLGFGREAAQHRFACRSLCRILEHGSFSDSATSRLVEEIVDDAKELSNHMFGSFVIRHILEFGSPDIRHKLVKVLSSDLMGYAKNKQGSHVVEAALRFGTEDDQLFITKQLISKKDQLLSLTASQFGRHVVKALIGMQGEVRKQVIDSLRPLAPQLQATRYGKSVLKEVRTATS